MLRIRHGKAGKYGLFLVCLAISVGIFQIQHLWRVCHQHPFFPSHDASRQYQVISKNGTLIHLPVAIGVGKQLYVAGAAFVQRVSMHFYHIQATVFIYLHRYRVSDERLTGDQFYLEPRCQLQSRNNAIHPRVGR